MISIPAVSFLWKTVVSALLNCYFSFIFYTGVGLGDGEFNLVVSGMKIRGFAFAAGVQENQLHNQRVSLLATDPHAPTQLHLLFFAPMQ